MFTIRYTDDETFEIFRNGLYCGYANHDENGWSGMEHIRDLVKMIAANANEEYREEGDPCV